MRAWLATALVIATPAAARADSNTHDGHVPHTVHRWSDWVPWSVVGAGAVAIGAGVVTYVEARSTMQAYDQGLATECPQGCTPADASLPGLVKLEQRAHWEADAAAGMLGAGAAVAITGVVLAYLNRDRVVYEPLRVAVVPAPSGGLVTWARSF